MKRARLSRLLTFAEVADLLGEEGNDRVRRVRRRLLAHTNAAEMLVRIGNSNPAHRRDGRSGAYGVRYRVSLEALREFIPQLRARTDDLVTVVREELEGLEEQIVVARQETRIVAAESGRRIKALEQRVRVLEGKGRAA